MLVPFALLLAAQATAPGSTVSTADRGSMVARCNARMAEIPITVTANGLPKQTKVKICGEVGQTDADWARTLNDALGKVELNARMPAPVKQQLVAGLKLEIAKARGGNAMRAETIAPTTPPPVAVLNSLPPSAAPINASPLVPRAPVDTNRVEYSALPPMPAPVTAASAAGVAMKPPPPPLPAPKLTLRCLPTDSLASESGCELIERGMLVTVRADENIAPGTSLRFMRRGDNRAEVDLLTMRRGQSQRFSLPTRVCQGVGGGRIEIQVVRAAGSSTQVVDTRGPFELRC